MQMTPQDIEKLCTLSRLKLSSEEKERMRSEFGSILEYIAAIQKVSASSAEKTRSIVAQVNIMREDANPHPSDAFTEALVSAAPRREGDYIKVKKIL